MKENDGEPECRKVFLNKIPELFSCLQLYIITPFFAMILVQSSKKNCFEAVDTSRNKPLNVEPSPLS
jgi:hypothetical protein